MIRLDFFQRKQALALMNAVARDSTTAAVQAFDEFFYPLVIDYIVERHGSIGFDVAAWMGASGSAAPELDEHQIEEAQQRAALIALRRARASAARFDPAQGSPVGWVLRAAAYAYVEVAKQLARDQDELAASPEALETVASPAEDLADTLARQQLVDDLLLVLSDDERRVVALVLKHEYTYKQAAQRLFGSTDEAKRVDHLLQSARKKMAPRWAQLQGDDADQPRES